MTLEPRGREVGLWRLQPALGRLLAAGLGSAELRSGALLTDFLEASVVGGRSRALGAHHHHHHEFMFQGPHPIPVP